jgi:hypothetical protein
VNITSQDYSQIEIEFVDNAQDTQDAQDAQLGQTTAIEAQRQAVRENAKRVLRESGLAQMLQEINKDELRRRGQFEEYDSLLLLKWGTGYTRRHIWVEIQGNMIRFRLTPHRKCSSSVPLCDGEYHTFTSQMWVNSDLLRAELYKYYKKPVAESSDD